MQKSFVPLLFSCIVQDNTDREAFVKGWLAKIDVLNRDYKTIRRIQTDCELLHLCTKDPVLLSTPQEGWIVSIDKENEYTVYLPSLSMVSRLKTQETFVIYQPVRCQLFLFHNEEKYKKKIRLQLV